MDSPTFRGPEAEDDPTGIRRLLAGLPDPGPMPDDVVQRITQRLAAEQESRSPAGNVTPLWGTDEGPSRARVIGMLGGAAAAVVVGVVVLQSIVGDTSGGLADFNGVAAPSSSATEANPVSGDGRRLTITLHETNYTKDGLATQARALHRDPGPTLRPLSAESQGIGPLGTRDGLNSCLDELKVSSTAAVIADFSQYEGRPAAVLVVDSANTLQVAVVGRSCTTGDPQITLPLTSLPPS